MRNNNPLITEENIKSFDFSPWGGIEGFLKASQSGGLGNSTMMKRVLPDLAHAVDMTAVAISSLPFEIVGDDGVVIDSSSDWQNVLGGMENPHRLIYLIASSLCGGAAYVFPDITPKPAIFNLQYFAPHTITPYIDRDGLQYFQRASDQGKTDKIEPENLIYFWLPDSDVEIGPALNNPLTNAAMDAAIILSGKKTILTYGERGYVPITLLGASGMPDKDQREKAEGFFDRLLKGGFNVAAKIFNMEKLTIQRVGAGMEELKQSYLEIRRDSKESIADAFGIPVAKFMSDAAYASEMDVLDLQWVTASRFVTIYQTIEETFTHQLYKPKFKASMRFLIETLNVFQEDEESRAGSLSQLVGSINTNPRITKLGMGILGYELDEDQEKELDAIISEAETEPEPQEEIIEAETTNIEQLPPPQDEFEEIPTKNLTPDEMKDLMLWYTKAKAWIVKDKSAADWENKHLPETIAAPIRAKLKTAKNTLDVMAAFRMENRQLESRESDIKALVAVIEEAIKVTK